MLDRHAPYATWLGLRGEPQPLARAILEIRRGHPAEPFLKDHLAIAAPTVVPQHDRRIQRAAIEIVEHIPGRSDAYFHNQARLHGVHSLEHDRQLRADNVIADADDESPGRNRERSERTLVGLDQRPRGTEEACTFRRKADEARRALKQALAKPILQPLNLQAYGRLGRV